VSCRMPRGFQSSPLLPLTPHTLEMHNAAFKAFPSAKGNKEPDPPPVILGGASTAGVANGPTKAPYKIDPGLVKHVVDASCPGYDVNLCAEAEAKLEKCKTSSRFIFKNVWAARKRKHEAEAEAELEKAKIKAAGLRLKDWWDEKKSQAASSSVDKVIKDLELEEESEQADSKIDPRDL
jgi:hypothetical protein